MWRFLLNFHVFCKENLSKKILSTVRMIAFSILRAILILWKFWYLYDLLHNIIMQYSSWTFSNELRTLRNLKSARDLCFNPSETFCSFHKTYFSLCAHWERFLNFQFFWMFHLELFKGSKIFKIIQNIPKDTRTFVVA